MGSRPCPRTQPDSVTPRPPALRLGAKEVVSNLVFPVGPDGHPFVRLQLGEGRELMTDGSDQHGVLEGILGIVPTRADCEMEGSRGSFGILCEDIGLHDVFSVMPEQAPLPVEHVANDRYVLTKLLSLLRSYEATKP